MLIGERNGLLSGLPYDAEVEYLESTGTQYVDTGVVQTADMTFDFFAETNQTNDIIGNHSARGGSGFITYANNIIVGYENGKLFAYQSNTASATNQVLFSDSIGYVLLNRCIVRYSSTTVIMEYGGATYTTTSLATPRDPSKWTDSFWLFYQKSRPNTGTLKIAALKIYANNTLVRDFIPVRVGTTGAMYDRLGVGGMNPDGSARDDGLYRNRGTGAFVLGPDKVSSVGGG